MDKLQLIKAFRLYRTKYEEEAFFIPRFKSLITNFSNCYDRSLLSGHITASAWVVDNHGASALLLNHKKLKRWLQPGGHADGDENILAVAIREVKEETGLDKIKLIEKNIFDIDIHLIPSSNNVTAHFHYDIRFLMVVDKMASITINYESNDFTWIPLEKVKDYTLNNKSINRMVLKTKLIFK